MKLLLALISAAFLLVAPAQAHANQICNPGLSTLVVHEPMTCEEGSAIANALGSHPYQTQFFQTNYRSGRWVACYDGPGWASFEL